jgi:Flp pilus assembly protein TadD
MFARALFGSIVIASSALAAAAHAQPGLSTGPDYDLIDKAERIDDNADSGLPQLRQQGLAALQAKDFATAESAFSEVLRRNPSAIGASFMLGLSKIGLEKWEEAKTALERAVVDEPNRPEPKTRLGLTYVMLQDLAGARRQRDALVMLDADCESACADAAWIKDGLAALDQALAPGVKARVSAASLAAVSVAPPTTQSGTFDPAKYSLVTFDNPEALYDLLTKEGRCLPNKTAAPRQPCALILYRPTDGSVGSLAANFKPVFKVTSRNAIWAIHDKQLQKIKIDNLYLDVVDVIGGKRTNYESVALVGNAENAANCEQGKPCLGNLVAEDMFNMYRNMPDSVVKVIWGGGMEDPGTVRVR